MMMKSDKEPALVSALRSKGDTYKESMDMSPEDEEAGEDPKEEAGESDLQEMLEEVQEAKGADKDAAIDAMISKLEAMKGSK